MKCYNCGFNFDSERHDKCPSCYEPFLFEATVATTRVDKWEFEEKERYNSVWTYSYSPKVSEQEAKERRCRDKAEEHMRSVVPEQYRHHVRWYHIKPFLSESDPMPQLGVIGWHYEPPMT